MKWRKEERREGEERQIKLDVGDSDNNCIYSLQV